MTNPNEDLIRRGYAAFATADMATLSELLSDDIVWHAPGNNQLSGTFRGKDEVFGTFQKIAELTGGNFKIDIHAVLADDEHVAVLTHVTGEREGRTLDDNSVQIFHVNDGKVTEQWLYNADVDASDRFWA